MALELEELDVLLVELDDSVEELEEAVLTALLDCLVLRVTVALELEERDVLGVELEDGVEELEELEELEEAVLDALDFLVWRALVLVALEDLRGLRPRPALRLSDLSPSSFVLVFLAALLLDFLVALVSFCVPKLRIGSSSELDDWGEGEREAEARRLFLPFVDVSTRGFFLRPCPVRSIVSSSSALLFLRRSVDTTLSIHIKSFCIFDDVENQVLPLCQNLLP